ncbi:MAG TPA: hypothetical protein VGH14_01175 [Solirubrobacterales bacterium]|jgi:hypothetical protein
MTEIETVTVTFEEMRRDVDRYLRLRKTKRLVITRSDEEILVLGPWLPGEERTPAPEGFLSELHAPPYPFHPDEPNFADNLYAYLRENGSST